MTTPASYILSTGTKYYVGSTNDPSRRMMDHRWRLRRGTHPNPALQEDYDESEEVTLRVIEEFPEAPRSGAKLRDLLRASEQKIINAHKGDPNMVNRSPNARGPNNGERMVELWKDEAWRAKTLIRLRAAASHPVSAETRARMAEAKRGSKHPKARAVIVLGPGNEEKHFPCASDAAKFFGTTLTILSFWITGRTPWPGTGRRACRPQNQWIAEWSARYASDIGEWV